MTPKHTAIIAAFLALGANYTVLPMPEPQRPATGFGGMNIPRKGKKQRNDRRNHRRGRRR